MSQPTRSKVRALERHRRAVARELAAHATGEPDDECDNCMGTGEIVTMERVPGTTRRMDSEWGLGTSYETETLRSPCGPCGGTGHHSRAEFIERGGTFDVHAAREHAKGLVALADEQTVFEDWCRQQGHGPERKPCIACEGAGEYEVLSHDGEDYWRTCWYCQVDQDSCGTGIEPWPGKLAREWPGDSSAPMGRSLVRLGQRILDMLEGQPSECQACYGTAIGKTETHGPFEGQGGEVSFTLLEQPCERCHGTGHNLLGKLPEVEWSPAVRRRVADEAISRYAERRSFDDDPMTPGIRIWQDGGKRSIWPYITRVCPRGEHRDCWQRVWSHPTEGDPDLDRRIEARMRYDQWARQPGQPPRHDPRAEDGDRLPAWRRGELEHARQRREREARRGDGRHWRGFEWTAELQGTIVE